MGLVLAVDDHRYLVSSRVPLGLGQCFPEAQGLGALDLNMEAGGTDTIRGVGAAFLVTAPLGSYAIAPKKPGGLVFPSFSLFAAHSTHVKSSLCPKYPNSVKDCAFENRSEWYYMRWKS